MITGLARSGRFRLLAVATLCVAASNPSAKVIKHIDLSGPFHVVGASLTVTQGPDVRDPIFEDERAPGQIHFCLKAASTKPCSPDLDDALAGTEPSSFSEIHYLDTADLVFPLGTRAQPLLHLQVSSLHAGNGSQSRNARVIAYRPDKHRFEVIFDEALGTNNNQEARYIASGPLRGSMITVHPMDGSPFGYWVTVHRLEPGYRYRRVLRYPSATHYGDGNRLAVIDSEMPNIQQRLGLWKRGQPLPLPRGRCPKPRLVKMELWCS